MLHSPFYFHEESTLFALLLILTGKYHGLSRPVPQPVLCSFVSFLSVSIFNFIRFYTSLRRNGDCLLHSARDCITYQPPSYTKNSSKNQGECPGNCTFSTFASIKSATKHSFNLKDVKTVLLLHMHEELSYLSACLRGLIG